MPSLIYANHSSWWDGLVSFEITRKAALDSFIMMEEKHLKKLFLFRRLGAFSVIREKPAEALKSINYAIELLSENKNKKSEKEKRAVWIFPQGEIKPNDLRPLQFYTGLAKIVQITENCAAIPMAMRYEFTDYFKPEIFVRIGAPDIFSKKNDLNRKAITRSFEEKLTVLLDELKNDITSGDVSGYENII